MMAMQLILRASDSEMRLDVRTGEELRLSFCHSIYGSLVEEAFVIGADGLHLNELRYEEPRLADYYGHENSERVGDWWLVDGKNKFHPSLALRVSADSCMKLSVGSHTIALGDFVRPGGSIRVAVAS